MEEVDLSDNGYEIQVNVDEQFDDSSLSPYGNNICDESSILLYEKSFEGKPSISNIENHINGESCNAEDSTQNDELSDIEITDDGVFDIKGLSEKSKNEIIKYIGNSLQNKFSLLVKSNKCLKEELEKHESQATQYSVQIEGLEKEVSQSKADAFVWENELLRTKERLSQEKVLLQTELTSRLEKAIKHCEAANRDKEEMVMKYAKAEKDIQEHGITLRSMEKLKDEIIAKDVKIKWAQTKLKTEMEAHKELQQKLDAITSKNGDHGHEMQAGKESSEKVIKEISEEENARMVALEKHLQETKALLILETQKLDDLTPLYRQLKAEHDNLTATHLLMQTELTTLKAKASTHQQEREESEKLFESLQSELKTTKHKNNELNQRLSKAESAQNELECERKLLEKERSRCQELQDQLDELSVELNVARQKESELLIFTQKLTEEDVSLRSQLMEAQGKALSLESEHSEKVTSTLELQAKLSKCVKEIQTLQSSKKIEEERLTLVINGLNEELNSLRTKISDLENDLVVQQRRQVNSLKDSKREVQKLRRKLETCDCSSRRNSPHSVPKNSGCHGDEETAGDERNRVPILYDTADSSSLDFRLPGWTPPEPLSQDSRTSSDVSLNTESSSHLNGPSSLADGESGISSELTQRALVNRIAKLQNDLLKKRDKIDFLEEHVAQLVQELKNKNKIINYYLLKEDSGTVAGSKSDDAKSIRDARKLKQAEILKHGGIMASVYSSTSKDTSMTLELSLEINKKLQAVLEDTLLKNITLKENLNTLGDEVAKLALQNSQSKKH